MSRPLTVKDLDEIHEELQEYSIPLSYDERGRPCYTLQFTGTLEEYETLKRKLLELE